jgi:hypothetical protein
VVTVIDLRTFKQVRAIPVGKAPHGMALRPGATDTAAARAAAAPRPASPGR